LGPHNAFHSAVHPESWTGRGEAGHLVSLLVLRSSRQVPRAAEQGWCSKCPGSRL